LLKNFKKGEKTKAKVLSEFEDGIKREELTEEIMREVIGEGFCFLSFFK